MHNRIQDAFEPIRATEGLKQKTNAFIHSEMRKGHRKARAPLGYALACCTLLLLVVCGVGAVHIYQTPVSYISVDINPSVELALNRFDRVVDATAYNDDGAQILQTLDLNHKRYTEAVELLLSDESFQRYLSQDSLLSFTVVSDKEAALLAGIQQCQGYAQANAVCHSANAQLVEDAHHSGLSFGKYQAFLELSQYDKTITAEDCKNLSMGQIRDLIRQHQTGAESPSSGGQGAGHHGGNGQQPGHGGGYGYRGGRGAGKE